MSLRAALALTALALAAAAPPARAAVSVDVSTPWTVPGHPVPVQLIIRSTAPDSLTAVVSCGAVSATATFPVGAGPVERRTVLLPALDGRAYGCAPRVDYATAGGDEGNVSGPVGPNDLRFAVVQPRPSGVSDHAGLLVDVTPEALPDRWQGFPATTTFIVGPAADDALTPTQRAALATWSRAGGRLVLLGDPDRLGRWRALGALATSAGLDAGLVDELLDAPAPLDDPPWDHRVPGTERVPVGGFVLVALTFAVLVGPVNLWWVIKRRRQRGLFFLTTPLLSLAACAVLIGYNLLSEGLGTRRAALQLTWLDGDRHEAVTLSGVTLFAGTGVGAFRADPEALVRPLRPTDDVYALRGGDAPGARPRAIRWGEADQELTGEWVPTRRNEQLVFVAPGPERRRLTVAPAPDRRWSLTNGLDVPVRRLRWVSPDEQAWWLPEPLAPGATATLIAQGPAVAEPPWGRLGPHGRPLWERAARPLHFTAELEQPLSPIPGPEASDEAPIEAWLMGPLAPAGVPPLDPISPWPVRGASQDLAPAELPPAELPPAEPLPAEAPPAGPLAPPEVPE